MISFTEGLWCCTVSVWPIGVTPAKPNSHYARSVLFLASGYALSLFFYFFFFFCFASLQASISHTHKEIISFFPDFHQAECQCFSFLHWLSPLSPPPPIFLPPALLFQLSFSFWLRGKAVYLFRQDLFPPPPLTSPHPPVFLSFSFHSLITFLFPPWLCTCRVSLWGGEGGEKKRESGWNLPWRWKRNF